MNQPDGERPTKHRVATWAAIAVVAAACLCGIIAITRGPDTSHDQEDSAKQACRGFVEDRLKAPATAEFTDETVTADGNLWTVEGVVDAQNTFGASIRSRYTCVIRDGGSRWHLTSLTGIN